MHGFKDSNYANYANNATYTKKVYNAKNANNTYMLTFADISLSTSSADLGLRIEWYAGPSNGPTTFSHMW
jgi:hypothetical protein